MPKSVIIIIIIIIIHWIFKQFFELSCTLLSIQVVFYRVVVEMVSFLSTVF